MDWLTVGLGIVVVVLAGFGAFQAHQLQRAHAKLVAAQAKPLPVAVAQPTAEVLQADLKAAYEAEITKATATFANDLAATSARLSEQVSRLTTSVIEEELSAYQATLEEVRTTANQAMEKIRAAVEEQRLELRQGMEADLAAERDRLAAKFDTKMGDVVSSYISESLGGGVDLGSQMQYVLASLEARKAELKQDLTNGL